MRRPSLSTLQRDFGLYIVNLFDTGQAARVLSLSSCGLAFLLDHFCDVKVGKSVEVWKCAECQEGWGRKGGWVGK